MVSYPRVALPPDGGTVTVSYRGNGNIFHMATGQEGPPSKEVVGALQWPNGASVCIQSML